MKWCWYVCILAVAAFLYSCQTRGKHPESLENLTDSTHCLTLQTYGFISADFIKMNAHRVAGEKFGIHYETVAACMVSDSLVKAVKKHNERVKNILCIRYGDHWEDLMDIEFKRELKIERDIAQLLADDTISKNILSDKKVDRYLEYKMDPVAGADYYLVDIYGFIDDSAGHRNVRFRRLLVNDKTGKILNINI